MLSIWYSVKLYPMLLYSFRVLALMDYVLCVLDGLMKAPVFVKAAPSFPDEVKVR